MYINCNKFFKNIYSLSMIQFYWDFAKIWKQKVCNIMKSFVIHCNAFFTRLTEILEKNSYSRLDKTVDYWLVNEFSVQNQGTSDCIYLLSRGVTMLLYIVHVKLKY
jgi:hypothetical protein